MKRERNGASRVKAQNPGQLPCWILLTAYEKCNFARGELV